MGLLKMILLALGVVRDLASGTAKHFVDRFFRHTE